MRPPRAIVEHYEDEKERFLQECLLCGLCAKECPIMDRVERGGASFEEIQQDVHDCIESGQMNDHAYLKAFACMECFKCTSGMCPKELNPMLVNELVKSVYFTKNPQEIPYGSPSSENSVQRLLASSQICQRDYEKITSRSRKQNAKVVFFPGCNVYLQPEKILSALDMFEALGDDYDFLPGLDYCCGDCDLFLGGIDAGAGSIASLTAALEGLQPELLVLWCPTCLCRFENNIKPAIELPFQIQSFAQYLATRMDGLELSHQINKNITLHEPCKAAYTGLDLSGPRDVLKQLPGVKISEMQNIGENSLCCGSGAYCWYPEAGQRMSGERLEEARQTGAEAVVTICHYCSQAFLPRAQQGGPEVINYITLIAEAMGIGREDKYKKYSQWADVDRILDDAEAYIEESKFDRNKIQQALQVMFGTEA